MAADLILVQNTKAWLAKALKDLRRVEKLLVADEADNEDAVFHCQQAVEKALKAFLTWHDQPFRKTHDIEALGAQCALVDESLQLLVEKAERLTEYAWLYRCPGDAAEPAGDDVAEAFKSARDVVQAVLSRLPAEVQP